MGAKCHGVNRAGAFVPGPHRLAGLPWGLDHRFAVNIPAGAELKYRLEKRRSSAPVRAAALVFPLP